MANNVIIPAFAAGELSPGLAARVDLAKYHVGAALLENVFVDYKGGASSRPGTQYIGPNASYTWLYKFVFSASQQYVLVFGDHNLRFIRNPGGATNHPNSSNAGFIQSGSGVRVVIDTPYPAGFLPDLKFAQSADILQITHPNYPRMVLRRLGETNWTLTEPNIGATIISPPNQHATITGLPADSHDPQNTTYLYTVTTVDQNGEESALAGDPFVGLGSTLSYFALVTGVDMANTPGTVTLIWNTVAGAAYYNVYKTIPGYANKVPPYTASFGFCGISYGTIFIDSNIVPDFTKAPPLHTDPFSPKQIKSITVTGSSGDWPVGSTDIQVNDSTGTGAVVLAVLDTAERGAVGQIVDVFILNPGENYTSPTFTLGGGGTSFSATAELTGAEEHPTAVAYNQQRLVVAGTTSQPTGIFASKTGFYDNFDRSNPVLDDDGFTCAGRHRDQHDPAYDPDARRAGAVYQFRHSAAYRRFDLGTEPERDHPILGCGRAAIHFGASRSARSSSTRTSSMCRIPAPPCRILPTIVYQHLCRHRHFRIVDAPVLSSHDRSVGLPAHAQQDCVGGADDGTLLSLTYLKEQEVIAWAHHHNAGRRV
jgi:hypothetical protein